MGRLYFRSIEIYILKLLPSTVFSYPCQYLILSVDIFKNLTERHKKFDLIVLSYISILLFLRSFFFFTFFSNSIFLVTSCLLILLTEFSVGHFFFFFWQLIVDLSIKSLLHFWKYFPYLSLLFNLVSSINNFLPFVGFKNF